METLQEGAPESYNTKYDLWLTLCLMHLLHTQDTEAAKSTVLSCLHIFYMVDIPVSKFISTKNLTHVTSRHLSDSFSLSKINK